MTRVARMDACCWGGGLKGQISEIELHTLRIRLTTGLLNKAGRGDLALTLPVGLVRA